MPITVTWHDGVAEDVVFTMPDDVLASMDSYRQTIQAPFVHPPQNKYADVKAMVVGVMVEQIVIPALANFPTEAIAAAKADLEAAQTAYVAAQAAAIPGFGL